jgi:2-dehydro-3-deoxyphosphogluconate aldolase/(4S)-4-hydroxy-2-oxoglutarate aldolase
MTLTTLRENWGQCLRDHRLIAVLRTDSPALAITLAELAAQAGVRLIEITWNSAQPQRVISHLRQSLPHCRVGTGTVLTVSDLDQALACGSQFCFTPHTNPRLIEQAVRANLPIIPGALTPTEIVTAWQAGASAVKVFPIQALGGVTYIQALQGPLGSIPLIPTGGVTVQNAAPLIQAGAIAVGLAGQLFPPPWVQSQDWPAIHQRIQQVVSSLVDPA